MKKYFGWAIIIVFFAALVGGFFFLKGSTSGTPLDVTFATTTISFATSTSAGPEVVREVPAGYKEYRNTDYGFSFFYPDTLAPQESHDRGYAMTVAFQGVPGEPGFQIYVAPINGSQITPDRFRMDEPSGVRKEPRDTMVAGVQAVAFQGFDAKIGQTNEVWFIHDHFLYEVSTYKELEPWLSDILQTWHFL